jgi:dGTPase
VYLQYPVLFPDIGKAQQLVIALFRHYVEPGRLPSGYEGVQGAIDYISGMTDRFAMDDFAKLTMPSVWRA